MTAPLPVIITPNAADDLTKAWQACKNMGLILQEPPPKSPKLNAGRGRCNCVWRYEFDTTCDIPWTLDATNPLVDSFQRLDNHQRFYRTLGGLSLASSLEVRVQSTLWQS